MRTLVDQRLAGKRLVLITNSDWPYTDTIMRHIVGHGAAKASHAAEAAPAETRTGGAGDGASLRSGNATSRATTICEAGDSASGPGLAHWRSLFDAVLVSSRKPEFFTTAMPLYEVPKFLFFLETLTGGGG